MSAPDRAERVDRLIELYCDWRRGCCEVRAAYEQFTAAPPDERALAYAVYGAALDREESTAGEYERQLMRVAFDWRDSGTLVGSAPGARGDVGAGWRARSGS